MSKFKTGLLAGGFVAAIAATPALAQDSTTAPAKPAAPVSTEASTNVGVGAVDAGKLIGEDVVDANGKTVGEIESVIVDTKGKVTSVVLDVSGWLESEKRISVPWTDLKADADGNIHSSITKESAQAAAGYKYRAETNRGKVLNDSGQVYAADGTQEPTTAQTTAADANRPAALNADGSINASKVVGVNVINNANDTVGEISEVLLDDSGKVSGVVVDVGGFLGIGTHPVKLAWNQVKMVNQDGKLQAVVNMDKNALKQMPEYKTNG
ncbi:PRC-barrel domain-containing protein [Dongia sp.]|uniref:PRC-barrel domain-containing protein n=1 Tax=Dongia sp. TaxID=1977262 RepID=UPI003750CF5E